MFDFEKFPVYIKAEKTYLKLTPLFSNKLIDRDLKDQLKRSSTSIILNIAEGSGKYTSNDKKNFYLISRGSVNECVAILRIFKLQNIITRDYFDSIYNDFLEIGKMLSGLINSMINKSFVK